MIPLLGPFNSSHTLLAVPVLQEAKLPLISATSASPAVTFVGDYIFRICFTDEIQGEILSEFAVEELKVKTAVVMTCEMKIYSIELGRIFSERFMMKEGKVLRKGGYLINSTDFKVILAPSGEKALEIYRKEHARIDLVILDLIMQGMGGSKCLKEI